MSAALPIWAISGICRLTALIMSAMALSASLQFCLIAVFRRVSGDRSTGGVISFSAFVRDSSEFTTDLLSRNSSSHYMAHVRDSSEACHCDRET